MKFYSAVAEFFVSAVGERAILGDRGDWLGASAQDLVT